MEENSFLVHSFLAGYDAWKKAAKSFNYEANRGFDFIKQLFWVSNSVFVNHSRLVMFIYSFSCVEVLYWLNCKK